MKNNLWKIPVLLGILMLLAAGGLCIHNLREGKAAAEHADTAMEALKEQIPEQPADPEPPKQTAVPLTEDLFARYEPAEPEETEAPADILLGDSAYCGYLTIPALELELPVQSGWSYPALKQSPCRVSGSAGTNDLIIAAHNYPAHFGRIGTLNAGDTIIFTDTQGTAYPFAVSYIEIIDGTEVDRMYSGESEEWDLTLYTCTIGGVSRVTVRADRITEESM